MGKYDDLLTVEPPAKAGKYGDLLSVGENPRGGKYADLVAASPDPMAGVELPKPQFSDTPAPMPERAPVEGEVPAEPQGLIKGPGEIGAGDFQRLGMGTPVKPIPDLSVPERTADLQPSLADAERGLKLQQKGWENLTATEKDEVRTGKIAGVAKSMQGNPMAAMLTSVPGKIITGMTRVIMDKMAGDNKYVDADREPSFMEAAQYAKHYGMAEPKGFKQRLFGEILPKLTADMPLYVVMNQLTGGFGTFTGMNLLEQTADRINVQKEFDSTGLKMALVTDALFKAMPALGIGFKATGGAPQAVAAELGNVGLTAGAFTGLGAVEQWANNQDLKWDKMPEQYLENLLLIAVLHGKNIYQATKTGARTVPVKTDARTQARGDWTKAEQRRGDATVNEMIRRAKKGDAAAKEWVRKNVVMGAEVAEQVTPTPKPAEPASGGAAAVAPAPVAQQPGLAAPPPAAPEGIPIERVNAPYPLFSGNASEQPGPLPVAPGADGAGAAVAMNGTTAAAPPGPAAEQAPPDVTQPDKFQPDVNMPVVRVPVSDLKLSKDVPNFKEDADPTTGVVHGQRLQGQYNELGTAPIVVWQRNDGTLEVISGRHRLDLAKRTKKQDIPAHVVREADGFTAQDALTLDSELNIRDGQGKVKDYANYFRQSGLAEEEASGRGLLARQAGRSGWAIGRLSEDNLYTAYRNRKIAEQKAVAIAEAAPNNDDLQRVGLEYALSNGSANAEEVRQYVNAVKSMVGRNTVEEFDLFGNNDAALNEARKLARTAHKLQNQRRNERKVLKGARTVSKVQGKSAEVLKRYGIEQGDVEAINARIEALDSEIEAWNHWATNPALVDQLRVEAGLPPVDRQVPQDAPANRGSQTMEEWQKANGIDTSAQGEMFGKGAVGDAFELRPEEQRGTETFAERKQREAKAAEAEKAQGDMFDGAPKFMGGGSQGGMAVPPSGVEGLKPATPEQRRKERREQAKSAKETANALDQLLKVWSPGSREAAKPARNILRKRLGEQARAAEVAHEAVKRGMWKMAMLPKDVRHEFVDAIEHGRDPQEVALKPLADKLRQMLDAKRDEVKAIRPQALKAFYETYFPHMWKRPDEAAGKIARILGTRPLKGSADFLKQRTYMTFQEGLDAGLEPVTENPVELVLLKLSEMDRFIMAHKVVNDLKARGLAKFVYARGGKAPDGYAPLDDNIFHVFLPPEITVQEAYDEILMDGLMRVARGLGINVQTQMKMRGRQWGNANRAGNVNRRFSGPESVLAHEIGHQLGYKFDLYNVLRHSGQGEYREITRGKNKGERRFFPDKAAIAHRKKIDPQWRALADARMEGIDPEDPNYKKYVRGKYEKEAVLLEAYIHAPEKFRVLAPDLFRMFEDFLKRTPQVSELVEVKPSLRLGTNAGQIEIPGVTEVGRFYAPEPVARVVNNHLSPGLRQYQVYGVLRHVGNILNQAQLALSGFHAMNGMLDTMSSYIGLGLREALATGEPMRGLGNLAMGVTPIAPLKTLINGRKLIRAYRKELLSPEMAKVVDMITSAGGRVGLDPFYYNQAIKSLQRDMVAFRDARGLQKLGKAARIPLDLAGSVLELANKPIMEWMVPGMKIGLFDTLAAHEMRHAERAGLTQEQLIQRLISVQDSVDNRLGQLAYDNLFWNRMLKDSLMLSVRSVGWNLGTYREYGGAPVDLLTAPKRIKEGDVWLSHKMGYVMGAVFITAVYGSLLYYLYNGKAPWDDKNFEGYHDLTFVPTGETRPDGSRDRITLPTYMKDLYAYSHHPAKTIQHKLHPLWGAVADVLGNEDFYGVQIRTPGAPVPVQILEAMGYGADQFVPFSVRNYMQQVDAGASPRKAASAFVGIVPAPASIARSETLRRILELTAEKVPAGSRTKAEFEKSKHRKEIINALRSGEGYAPTPADKRLFGKDGLAAIADEAMLTYMQAAFKRLDVKERNSIWQQATDAERRELAPIMLQSDLDLNAKQFLRKSESAQKDRIERRKLINKWLQENMSNQPSH